jgi:hypothetical protein
MTVLQLNWLHRMQVMIISYEKKSLWKEMTVILFSKPSLLEWRD